MLESNMCRISLHCKCQTLGYWIFGLGCPQLVPCNLLSYSPLAPILNRNLGSPASQFWEDWGTIEGQDPAGWHVAWTLGWVHRHRRHPFFLYTLLKGYITPQYEVCDSNQTLKAEAKCQARDVLPTKLQAWRSWKGESQLFVCRNLQLIEARPRDVPWASLGPNCGWQKL